MSDRLSICYAAPGHTLVSTAGSARNILAAAEALTEFVDVTVAFRQLAEPFSSTAFEITSILPEVQTAGARDDVAARGLNPFAHWSDLKAIDRFAKETRGKYDLVMEKGWRLSGYLARAFHESGTPSVLIENDARFWNDPISTPRAFIRYLVHLLAQRVAARCSQRLPLVIAETDQLRSALIQTRGLSPSTVEVVGLGVDHDRFFPKDQTEARRQLAISESALVMLYVGGMDQYHDLSPLLESLAGIDHSDWEVHLVGDGEYKERYEGLANRAGARVRFHGQVPHERVPDYIACADVCLAPYQVMGFHGGEVGFSTLKIPEYMACARPVISVPSGHILKLIRDGETGFLFPNEPGQWSDFLRTMPERSLLRQMGTVAAPSVAHLTWRATAQGYLDASEAALGLGSFRRT